jgi:hypothetical protein
MKSNWEDIWDRDPYKKIYLFLFLWDVIYTLKKLYLKKKTITHSHL